MADHRKSYKFTDMEVVRLEALAEKWGNVEPLTETGTIREALRRAMVAEGLEAETVKQKTKTRITN